MPTDPSPTEAVAWESREGFATCVLRSPSGRLALAVVPAAGLLTCSLTCDGVELLGLAGGIRTHVETRAPSGVSLLHPWVNRLDRFGYGDVTIDPASPLLWIAPEGLPCHGVAHGQDVWSTETSVASEGTPSLHARLVWDRPDLFAAFPYPHELRVTIALHDGEAVWTTELRATGDVAVPVAFGWHPYLRVPGVAREAWEAELPFAQHVEVDERLIPTGALTPAGELSGPLGARTFDDAYTAPPGTQAAVAGGGLRFGVRWGEGYELAQVYVPPDERPMICLEPTTAPANALNTGDGLRWAQPAESFRAVFAMTVEGSPAGALGSRAGEQREGR